MHGLDPATTVLTAALALMTAFALATERPFGAASGGTATPARAAAAQPVIVRPGDGWVALNAPGMATLPPLASRGR